MTNNVIARYYDHIINNNISDSSIIIMIDAYDVMLFPRIKTIGRVSLLLYIKYVLIITITFKVLSSSTTPIVFCSEYGVYPEIPSNYYYRQSSSSSSSSSSSYQEYLNSGCIAGIIITRLLTLCIMMILMTIGRAGQIKAMLQYANDESDNGFIYKDDQQLYVRYFLVS